MQVHTTNHTHTRKPVYTNLTESILTSQKHKEENEKYLNIASMQSNENFTEKLIVTSDNNNLN